MGEGRLDWGQRAVNNPLAYFSFLRDTKLSFISNVRNSKVFSLLYNLLTTNVQELEYHMFERK